MRSSKKPYSRSFIDNSPTKQLGNLRKAIDYNSRPNSTSESYSSSDSSTEFRKNNSVVYDPYYSQSYVIGKNGTIEHGRYRPE